MIDVVRMQSDLEELKGRVSVLLKHVGASPEAADVPTVAALEDIKARLAELEAASHTHKAKK